MKKMIYKIIVFVSATLLMCNVAFAINMATLGLDSSLMNSYIAEDESGNSEIKKIVDYFIQNFITRDMTDFEKAMQIIKYLVETVTYDIDELEDDTPYINDSYKAYGALVNHKAVCSGYAKAFDLLAKKCGLSTTVVTGEAINSSNLNGPHAWNQIYLDGEWYNVDVTWEDPITNVKLGFDNLLNEYINRTDADFSKDHIRENGNICVANKFGKNTVTYYLSTGIVDANANIDALRRMLLTQIDIFINADQSEQARVLMEKLSLIGAKYDDNSNFVVSGNDLEVTNYILTNLAAGNRVISVVTGPNTANTLSIDTGHWMEDNLNIQGKIQMQRYFSSDGKYDTRILVFKFE